MDKEGQAGVAGGLGHREMWPVTPQPTEHMGQGWGHAGFESHSGEGSSPVTVATPLIKPHL